MSGEMAENLLYIAAAVLLPLIPAYILYKALPERGSVGGVLGLLTHKLSGAFTGYLALVLIVFAFVYSRPRAREACPDCPIVERPRYTVYKVQGRLQPEVDKVNLTKDTSLTLHPPVELLKNGFFEFDVSIDQDTNAASKNLEIAHEGFNTEIIPLSEKLAENPIFKPRYSVKFDESTKTIQVQGMIVLEKEEGNYSGGAKLPSIPSPETQENKP